MFLELDEINDVVVALGLMVVVSESLMMGLMLSSGLDSSNKYIM